MATLLILNCCINMLRWRYLRNFKLRKLGIFLIGTFLLYYVLTIYFHDFTKKKILIWWTPFMPAANRVIECYEGEYKCIITSNRTFRNHEDLGAFLMYGSHIVNYDFPLPKNAPWAIFHEESPKNYAPFLFDIQDLFDITSTFSRYSDFPITLHYLSNLSTLTDKKYYTPINIRNSYLKIKSPVLYIQSDCDTPIGRDFLVKELKKYIEIDSYGKCLRNKKFPEELKKVFPLDLYNNQYLRFISKYKFIIAFENSLCEDYVTEKFWRTIMVGSVPIYLGAPNIEDWIPNKQSAILVKDFKNMKEVANYINIVNQNDSLFESFLKHKLFGQITNDLLIKNILSQHPISGFECYVCKKIHENNLEIEHRKKNVYNCPKPVPRDDEVNTWDQHWEIGKCQSKALKILIGKDKPYSEDEFQNLWKTFFKEKTCWTDP